MRIDIDLPLGEIVNGVPGSAQVFEAFGLDYCCGGQHSLADACEMRGASIASVLEALEALDEEASTDWPEMGPTELVDHLESTHHVYLRRELPRLEALAEKVASVHGGRHGELLDLLADVKELREELEPHLDKEEQVLFPMIRQVGAADGPVALDCGSLRNPISVMLMEHDAAGALLQQIRERTGGYAVPADGCASYRALFEGLGELETDTHLHVHKENNLLFPAVIALEDRTVATT
jgi:regulator of cell morphogenesis and NO signaling